MSKYTIGDAARISHLNTHTLRFYEAKGIILPKRDSHNRRTYSEKDMKWLEIVVLLKGFGLSLKQLKNYSESFYKKLKGKEVLSILTKQKAILEEQQMVIQEQISGLEQKITLLNGSPSYLKACQALE